ncbi:hypothetical protein Tco_0365380 [Tanacetum coccineum]
MTSHVVVAVVLAVWYPNLVKPSLAMFCVHSLLKLVIAMNDKYSSTSTEILAEGIEDGLDGTERGYQGRNADIKDGGLGDSSGTINKQLF